MTDKEAMDRDEALLEICQRVRALTPVTITQHTRLGMKTNSFVDPQTVLQIVQEYLPN